MSRNQKIFTDPVAFTGLGLTLVTVVIVIIVFQSHLNVANITDDSGIISQLIIAFVTGLAAGSLSCLTIQSGLLASSLAHQFEQDYLEPAAQHIHHDKMNQAQPRSGTTVPILLFLVAKIVAYTALGALLGLLGSYLTFGLTTRAILMLLIGVFMLGNGLRLLDVHPVFRYFSIEPPKFITRYIRRTAKGLDTFTPLFLGALTVFIPCSVTQAMMATALGTGNLVMGAMLMFAFTLGTSPVFFILAYLTTELGARLERFFMRFVAAVVLLLGLITINSGLNVLGSPFAFQNITGQLFPSNSASEPGPGASQSSADPSEIVLQVQNDGYFPQTITAPAGKTFTLNLVTNKTFACSRDFVIPALDFQQLLPDTGTTQVSIPPQEKGSKLFFTCSMGMYTGQIVFK